MTDGGETVAEVLGNLGTALDVTAMMDVAEGIRDPDDLTYEDWAQPMKLTGGRVCLEVTDEHYGLTWYFRRRSDGMLEQHDPSTGSRWTATPLTLLTDLRADTTTVTPVLREGTPFGGGTDE